jgi:hypothetical protein
MFCRLGSEVNSGYGSSKRRHAVPYAAPHECGPRGAIAVLPTRKNHRRGNSGKNTDCNFSPSLCIETGTGVVEPGGSAVETMV